ncbi:MAG: fimbrillin family protein [Prevotella sp.]|nr:fimbrillin family protein [Prevotella sp.]
MIRRNIVLGCILLPLALTSCSREPATDDVGGRQSVDFATYLSHSTTMEATAGTSRSAVASAVSRASTRATTPYYNIETVNDLMQTGFGVTAYATGEKDYTAGQKDYIPNFMYNQLVSYDAAAKTWDYAPTVYWPEGKTSFFAYAPYQQDASERITAMNGKTDFLQGNAVKGDATVTYSVAEDPTKSVDLLWATNTEGLPWLNQTKPAVSSRLTFYFRHALAKVNLQAEYVVEKGTEEDTQTSANTLVLIDSIYVDGDGSMPSTATLSLANTTASTPLWSQPSGNVKVVIGSSALNGKYASASVTDADAFKKVKEGGGGLPMILNGGEDKATDILLPMTSPAGNATPAALMLIPSSTTSSTPMTMRVTVVYTIVSYDENLIYNNPQFLAFTRHQRVSGSCTFSGGLVAGRVYNVRLKVGLHALRFQVDADNWQEPVGFSPAVYPWTTGDGSDKDLTIDK